MYRFNKGKYAMWEYVVRVTHLSVSFRISKLSSVNIKPKRPEKVPSGMPLFTPNRIVILLENIEYHGVKSRRDRKLRIKSHRDANLQPIEPPCC